MHPRAQHLQAPRVAQRLEPLERRGSGRAGPRSCERARWRVGRALNTSATLWPPNANEFDIATGGRPLRREQRPRRPARSRGRARGPAPRSRASAGSAGRSASRPSPRPRPRRRRRAGDRSRTSSRRSALLCPLLAERSLQRHGLGSIVELRRGAVGVDVVDARRVRRRRRRARARSRGRRGCRWDRARSGGGRQTSRRSPRPHRGPSRRARPPRRRPRARVSRRPRPSRTRRDGRRTAARCRSATAPASS